MKKTYICVLLAFCTAVLNVPLSAYAEAPNNESIIVAIGEEVPPDDHLPEEHRFPAKYRANAVQFQTEDGVLLCGWVIGEGTKGVSLGHANGWRPASWLPFGERLADAGYRVIIWEFRNNPPSGDAAPGEDQRWDLDVLAAVQVLREYGVTEIFAMGASDGGNATAVAAPNIPELVGLGILSSPARSKGDGPAALSQISVPAFFAVSSSDPGSGGSDRFLQEVQTLYDACASEQKELHVLTSYEHGSDLLSEEDMYSGGAYGGSSEEQKQERRQLADDLMRFINGAFGTTESENTDNAESTPSPTPPPDSSEAPAPTQPAETNSPSQGETGGSVMIWLAAGLVIIISLVVVIMRRKKH